MTYRWAGLFAVNVDYLHIEWYTPPSSVSYLLMEWVGYTGIRRMLMSANVSVIQFFFYLLYHNWIVGRTREITEMRIERASSLLPLLII